MAYHINDHERIPLILLALEIRKTVRSDASQAIKQNFLRRRELEGSLESGIRGFNLSIPYLKV